MSEKEFWTNNLIGRFYVIRTWVNGELVGTYGSFTLPGQDDHYNTEPFGDEEPLPPSAVPPTTRGFYNEEFSPLNLEADCKFCYE